MNDLISREAVIDVIMETIAPPSYTLDTLVMRIDSLPSAQQTGEWITHNYELTNGRYECSACHSRYNFEHAFCPNCGAYTRGGEDERN